MVTPTSQDRKIDHVHSCVDAGGVLTSLQKNGKGDIYFEILTGTGLIPSLYINATVGKSSTQGLTAVRDYPQIVLMLKRRISGQQIAPDGWTPNLLLYLQQPGEQLAWFIVFYTGDDDKNEFIMKPS